MATTTIQHHWNGFETHKGPFQCPKECYDGTWEYTQGQRIHWKGHSYGKQVQGEGTVTGTGAGEGPMKQWIVELSAEDAPHFIPGGFRCTSFFAYCMRPAAAASASASAHPAR